MKSPTARFCVLLTLLASLRAPAADWPRWRGPTADGHVPATAAVPASLPAEPVYTWRKKVGFGLGSPVVSAGVVYYLDHQENKETVHAADAATGVDRWTYVLDDAFKDNQAPAGPRSTPVVDGNRVYVTSCKGEFQCLDTATGKPVWGVNFVRDFKAVFTGEKGQTPGAGRHGNTGSPWIEGHRIFVNVGGSEGASVVCFDKRDGKVLWKSQSDIPGNGGPVVATLAGRPQVITFTVEAVIGLDFATGALLWRVPVKTSFGRHVASPVVLGDLVIAGSHQAGLLGIKVARAGDNFTTEHAYIEKRVAINFSSPVVRDGFIYGLGPAGFSASLNQQAQGPGQARENRGPHSLDAVDRQGARFPGVLRRRAHGGDEMDPPAPRRRQQGARRFRCSEGQDTRPERHGRPAARRRRPEGVSPPRPAQGLRRQLVQPRLCRRKVVSPRQGGTALPRAAAVTLSVP